jgi:hypothetical protein
VGRCMRRCGRFTTSMATETERAPKGPVRTDSRMQMSAWRARLAPLGKRKAPGRLTAGALWPLKDPGGFKLRPQETIPHCTMLSRTGSLPHPELRQDPVNFVDFLGSGTNRPPSKRIHGRPKAFALIPPPPAARQVRTRLPLAAGATDRLWEMQGRVVMLRPACRLRRT